MRLQRRRRIIFRRERGAEELLRLPIRHRLIPRLQILLLQTLLLQTLLLQTLRLQTPRLRTLRLPIPRPPIRHPYRMRRR